MQISRRHRQVLATRSPQRKSLQKRTSDDLLQMRARSVASHGDTPYWQLVQECSALRANHGRACSLSQNSEEAEAFFNGALVEFMILSNKKSSIQIALRCCVILYMYIEYNMQNASHCDPVRNHFAY